MPKYLRPGGKGLNPLQDRFVDEFLVDGIASRAYRRAGFKGTDSSCRDGAMDLTRKPHIIAAIEERTAKLRARMAITQENVLAEYARIGFFNLDDCAVRDEKTGSIKGLDVSKLSRDQLAAIRTLNFDGTGQNRKVSEVRLHDKIAALHKLGVHLRLFNDDEAPAFTKVIFTVERTKERKAPKQKPPMEG